MRHLKVRLPTLAVLAFVVSLAACESIGYYGQAVSGQLGLLRQRQSINTVLQNAQLPATQRQQLELVLRLRNFADRELLLPVSDQYSTYVDLSSDFVVWNVFAAPEFSMTPRQWCYPIAGCSSYRGYFSERAAQRYAAGLRQQGFDVYVGGVGAYSTLGWFEDPVLSPMLRRDEAQLAALLFHELAHQLVYVAGDTAFNESFATLVEREGQRRWIAAQEPQRQAVLQQAAVTAQQRQAQFVALVQNAAAEMATLYHQTLPPAQMRADKTAIQMRLRADYEVLKIEWNGYAGYDRWFAGELNNAQLATVTTYNQWVSAFQRLLDQHNGELSAFYQSVRKLAALKPAQRLETLQSQTRSDS
ncbi:MAG: aminopeptidase [Pseudomonadota bacterium]